MSFFDSSCETSLNISKQSCDTDQSSIFSTYVNIENDKSIFNIIYDENDANVPIFTCEELDHLTEEQRDEYNNYWYKKFERDRATILLQRLGGHEHIVELLKSREMDKLAFTKATLFKPAVYSEDQKDFDRNCMFQEGKKFFL